MSGQTLLDPTTYSSLLVLANEGHLEGKMSQEGHQGDIVLA
jgi:hypothetical protein